MISGITRHSCGGSPLSTSMFIGYLERTPYLFDILIETEHAVIEYGLNKLLKPRVGPLTSAEIEMIEVKVCYIFMKFRSITNCVENF